MIDIPVKEHSSASHYMIMRFMEEIAQPWFAGGDQLVNNLAKGFADVHDFSFYEDFLDNMSRIISGISIRFTEVVDHPDTAARYLEDAAALIRIVGEAFYDYEAWKKENEAAKTSQP